MNRINLWESFNRQLKTQKVVVPDSHRGMGISNPMKKYDVDQKDPFLSIMIKRKSYQETIDNLMTIHMLNEIVFKSSLGGEGKVESN
jgi:hypothetical protein